MVTTCQLQKLRFCVDGVDITTDRFFTGHLKTVTG